MLFPCHAMASAGEAVELCSITLNSKELKTGLRIQCNTVWYLCLYMYAGFKNNLFPNAKLISEPL